MRQVPAKQWRNWAERIVDGKHLEEEMQNAGMLPHADTPLPPTNATIHILGSEVGYGTPDRRFYARCGTSWLARESTGEHKYFTASEEHWFKHVNCAACRRLMEGDDDGEDNN